jgi:hypothetical protein
MLETSMLFKNRPLYLTTLSNSQADTINKMLTAKEIIKIPEILF